MNAESKQSLSCMELAKMLEIQKAVNERRQVYILELKNVITVLASKSVIASKRTVSTLTKAFLCE